MDIDFIPVCSLRKADDNFQRKEILQKLDLTSLKVSEFFHQNKLENPESFLSCGPVDCEVLPGPEFDNKVRTQKHDLDIK